MCDMPGPPTLLTISETARELRLSRASVYTLLEQGELTAIRVTPRRQRIPLAELAAYLERQRVRSAG
jgi:excisionase family DNA binding protein